ncbi:MAG: hypothetical protein K0S82_243 [Gaiellaceae bacterium]|nr:hypothetical protein [Gaiellaceae bacterium]
MRRLMSIGIVVVVFGASLFAVASASAEGVNPAHLQAQGWTCFVPPPFPDTIVCGNPAHGLPPVPADPNGQPSYSFLLFDLDGSRRGSVHMIRADLYRGQPCPQTGGLYVFNPANGYYRCGL